jgi:hypothetical protein
LCSRGSCVPLDASSCSMCMRKVVSIPTGDQLRTQSAHSTRPARALAAHAYTRRLSTPTQGTCKPRFALSTRSASLQSSCDRPRKVRETNRCHATCKGDLAWHRGNTHAHTPTVPHEHARPDPPRKADNDECTPPTDGWTRRGEDSASDDGDGAAANRSQAQWRRLCEL